MCNGKSLPATTPLARRIAGSPFMLITGSAPGLEIFLRVFLVARTIMCTKSKNDVFSVCNLLKYVANFSNMSHNKRKATLKGGEGLSN